MKVKLTEEERKVRQRMTRVKWKAANPEKVRKSHARYYAANPEKVKATQARYYAANSEKVEGRKARWKAANPEKAREARARYKTKYVTNNLEKVRAGTVRYLLCKGTNLRPSDIPQELIDLKLKQIQMKQVMYANSK